MTQCLHDVVGGRGGWGWVIDGCDGVGTGHSRFKWSAEVSDADHHRTIATHCVGSTGSTAVWIW
jgi:hypothetical protein